MRVLSLFDGISCGMVALERAGISVDKYYSSEIDEAAIKISDYNYPNIIRVGDVRGVNCDHYKNIDLLIGGSPCQSFSFAGKMQGMITKEKKEITTLEQYLRLKENGFEFEGYSYLFWEYVRILKQVKPKYFLLENVKMDKKWEKIISGVLGVEPILINSSLVSAQNRERLYWTNIPNVTQPKDRNIKFCDIIEKENRKWLPIQPWTQVVWGTKKKIEMLRTFDAEKSFCVTTNKTHCKNYYLNSAKTRMSKLTADEVEVLQTLPKGYTDCVSECKRFKAIGNGWTVDVIAHIFKGLKKSTELKNEIEEVTP